MRFAVISDIQANLAALQAVLASIDGLEEPVEQIVSAGDTVGLGPQPNEVLDLLRERDIQSVRGNYEDAIAFDRLSSGVDFPNAAAEERDRQALRWTRRTLTDENMAYMRRMPEDVRLYPSLSGMRVKRDDLRKAETEYGRGLIKRAMFGGLLRSRPTTVKKVRVLHGSPRAMNEFIREDTANSILEAIARQSETDLLITGHAEEQFRRDAAGMMFLGVGSVSGPNAELGEAEYTVVTVGGEVGVDFERVPYDLAQHRQAILASGLPASPVR